MSVLPGSSILIMALGLAAPLFALAAVVGFVHLLTARRKVKAPGAWA
jgi:hypothetical protein